MAGEPSGEVLVAAIGQAAAGDDGVGFAVLEELRRRSPQTAPGLEDAELLEVSDLAALLPLLCSGRRVILIDGVVGAGKSGEVRVFAPAELAGCACATLSSHGLDIATVLGLAESLAAPAPPPRVEIVGVTIAAPQRLRLTLSPAVQAAVPRAASIVAALLVV
jgi:hydrogenase maturation protease